MTRNAILLLDCHENCKLYKALCPKSHMFLELRDMAQDNPECHPKTKSQDAPADRQPTQSLTLRNATQAWRPVSNELTRSFLNAVFYLRGFTMFLEHCSKDLLRRVLATFPQNICFNFNDDQPLHIWARGHSTREHPAARKSHRRIKALGRTVSFGARKNKLQ